MSRLIITQMDFKGRRGCVCALEDAGRVLELRLEPCERTSILGNIYVGQVENIAANIQAAFVQIAPGVRGYFPLSEAKYAIYASGRRGNAPLRPGDEILVQVSRDAMKGKLPSLTANLNFTGKYLVLTAGNRKFGYSAKLSQEDKERLAGWLEEENNRVGREFGVIVRTNAAAASKEEIFRELDRLKEIYRKVAVDGRCRTCFSLLYETEPAWAAAVRDTYTQELDEIVTDIAEYYGHLRENPQIGEASAGSGSRIHKLTVGAASSSGGSARPKSETVSEMPKLRFYEDPLLPLYKLYRLEKALDEIRSERVWLASGGFLVIQQTEAFVSIDVNSGKFVGKKKAEETYRKINLEAAAEIARQLRLRNLSGIILIDFINMENPDHTDELFHVLAKLLRKDPVRAKAVDVTPLGILEMTRQKIRRPLIEELRELEYSGSFPE